MPIPCLESVAVFDREASALLGLEAGTEQGGGGGGSANAGVARCFQCVPVSRFVSWSSRDGIDVAKDGDVVYENEVTEDQDDTEKADLQRRENSYRHGRKRGSDDSNGGVSGGGGHSARASANEMVAVDNEPSSQEAFRVEEGVGGAGAALASGVAAALIGAVLSSTISSAAEAGAGSESGGDAAGGYSTGEFPRGADTAGSKKDVALLGSLDSSGSAPGWASDSSLVSPRLRGTGARQPVSSPPLSPPPLAPSPLQSAKDAAPTKAAMNYSWSLQPIVGDGGRPGHNAQGRAGEGEGESREDGFSEGQARGGGGPGAEGEGGVVVESEFFTLKPASSGQKVYSGTDSQESVVSAADRELQVGHTVRFVVFTSKHSQVMLCHMAGRLGERGKVELVVCRFICLQGSGGTFCTTWNYSTFT